jgi:signal transduction histidine kinase
MDFAFNVYSLTLIFFGSISILLSLYILNNETGAVRWVGWSMLSNAIWSVAYGLELASDTLEQIKILVNIEYIGIVSLPVYWFLLCIAMSGKEVWLRKTGNKILVTIVPAVTLLLVWTNDLHHLHYSQLILDYSGSFPMLKITRGVSYYLFTLYFYILLGIGDIILIQTFRKSDAVYRNQNRVVMIAAMLPWLANICYMVGLRPMANLDVTPFAFLISVAVIFIAIYRFELFDILPVAREKVLELMQDAFVVLDSQNRIIDYNPAFKKYTTALLAGQLVGKNFMDVLPEQNQMLDFLHNHESGKMEMMIETTQGTFDVEVDIRFLNQNKLIHNAIIIKFQDLTSLRQEALKSKQQADELQKLNQLKDRIFSIMAHDLRGPLLNLGEVLKMTFDDTISAEEFKILAPTLTKDISYTADLLENILHWSRSQLKGYSINREQFDLNKLIVSEISYHVKSATSKKIRISHHLTDKLTVYADLVMMQMVLRNLLSNAIKFCHKGCEIKIIAAPDAQDFVNLQIRDDGVGISEENILRIFSGENVSSRGTQNEKGTGIGLMVCWDFMARNEGTIVVKSVVGEGTVFNLQIPSAHTAPLVENGA